MKKILLLTVLSILWNASFSQVVQLGKEAKNSSFVHIPDIIHKDNDKMYVIRMSKVNPQGVKILKENKKATVSAFFLGYGRANSDESVMKVENYYSKGNDYSLEIYDNNMNLTKSYPFEVMLEKSGMLSSTASKAIFPKNIFYLNNKITLFSTLYDSKAKKVTAGYHFLSNEGVLDKELNILSQISVTDDDLEKEISFDISPDHSKVVLYYPVEAESKTAKPGVFVKVINTSDFSVLWENQYLFQDADVEIEKILLNNQGTVYLLTRIGLEGQEKEQSVQKYKYMLYLAKKGSKALDNFNLKISDQYFLNNVLIKFDNKSNILASGFYSEKSANYAKGAYVTNIDANNGSLLINALVPFSSNVSEDKDEDEKEKAFYHMREISFLNDGSIVLIGEQYYIDISRSRGYGAYGAVGGSTNFTFRYKDILVMSLSPNGELKWMKNIPKKQITANDGAMYSSFVPMVLNNKISIMVNGHKDGLDKRMSAFTDNNMVYLLEFDAAGKMEQKSLYSGEEAESRLSPKVSYKVSDKEVILYNVRRSGNYRFAKVTF